MSVTRPIPPVIRNDAEGERWLFRWTNARMALDAGVSEPIEQPWKNAGIAARTVAARLMLRARRDHRARRWR